MTFICSETILAKCQNWKDAAKWSNMPFPYCRRMSNGRKCCIYGTFELYSPVEVAWVALSTGDLAPWLMATMRSWDIERADRRQDGDWVRAGDAQEDRPSSLASACQRQ